MNEPIVRKVEMYAPTPAVHAQNNSRAINQLCDLINQGLIMESPDGTRFRLKVDDAGALSAQVLE